MANTIRAAKNTFYGGLVMDLSPDTTPNEVLTSALNATLVTFNGNEMLLQNDMGNGRVETARLPEGYIPVGTCEFGDIIYIVSYNPLTNKSQIGCFPSPERNISSEEIGNTGLSLSASDFQVLDNDVPTGELKANSVKKILYQNKLNPGDKFVIYDTNKQILKETHITDIGNTSHTYGSFPKWLKIHVIAIEDSGKITYLDSSMKWYKSFSDLDSKKPTDYFIRTSKEEGSNKPDIDSYRNLLNSGYSVYLSKISGKLALLIELEKIEGFSCTYTVYSKNTIEIINNTNKKDYGEIYGKRYYVYWNFNWNTSNPNINPKWIVLTKSEWTGREEGKGGTYYKWVLDNNNNNNNNNNNKYYLNVGETIKLTNKLSNKLNNDIVKDLIPLEWEAEITSDIDISDYKTFIGNNIENTENTKNTENAKNIENTKNKSIKGSYLVILDKFLKDRKNPYGNMPLTKLNICRINNDYYKQLPNIGQYYINATKLEYKKLNGLLTELAYTLKYDNGTYTEIESVAITDDIVNNYFHYPIYKAFTEFTIPIKQVFGESDNNTSNKTNEETSNEISENTSNENSEEIPTETSKEKTIDFKPDIRNLIYHYEITPAMPYGLLREYSIDGYIDFSKIGTGEINLKSWKYFNGENISTLTIGMDAYVEDNMGIQSVVLEFYDNLGMAAAYHITDKSSYSGQFTEMIPLNGSTNTYKLQNIDAEGNKHLHLGQVAHEGDTNLVRLEGEGEEQKIVETNWTNDKPCYIDDCGTLYSNMLYLVKIIVKYCPINALGEFDTSDSTNYRHFYRWMWTNTMFNQYYHNITDFNDIQLELTLDLLPKYELTDSYYYGLFEYNSPNEEPLTNSDNVYKYLSAKVLVISDTDSAKNAIYNQDESELIQDISKDLQSFTIKFTKKIKNIKGELIKFECNGIVYIENKDYRITTLNNVFKVNFLNIGNTYTMDIHISTGAIILGDDTNTYINNEINYKYSYRNGAIDTLYKYNTRISVEPGLQDTYQVFNLDADYVNKNIKVEVIIDGDLYVENDIPLTMHAGNSNFKQFEGINNENSNSWDLSKYGDKFKSLLLRYFSNYAKAINDSKGNDIYENKEAYKDYNNLFNVTFEDKNKEAEKGRIKGQYLGYMQNSITADEKYCISKSLKDINGSNDNSYIFINTNIIHFSKYYNIYKSSNISVPVLLPVLHTKEDLDKLNMTISDNNVWINSLSMFTAWNDKTGNDQDYRREYQYECDIKNGRFYVKKDYMKEFGHDANEKWDYSQYRQHSNSKHFITDLDKVSEEDYNEYFPRGFMLFTLSSERSEMVINTDNVKSTKHYSKNVPSSWQQCFNSTSYYYYLSTHGFANRVGDDTILAGLYYRGDKEDNVHLLNCWFTLLAYGEGDNRYVTQKIAYTLDYSTKKPLYIGTCIASVFANIYHYVKDTDIPIALVVDTVYLSEHTTTYTKDMVYRISVDIKKEKPNIKEPSELLIFKGIMKYGGANGYVEFVKKKARATNDPQYSGDKNVKAIIRDCVKNVPLLYKLAYKEPNTDLINANNDLILLKTIDNPSGTRAYGKLSPNKLYLLDYDIDGKLSINNLTSTFKIKYLTSIKLDPNTEIVSGEFSKWFLEDNNPNMWNTWSIKNDLTLSNYSYVPTSSKYYSIIAAAGTFKILFADYDKDEILLPFAKFV